MFRQGLSLLVLFVFLLVPAAAQDEAEDEMKVAIFNYANSFTYIGAEGAILDMLSALNLLDGSDFPYSEDSVEHISMLMETYLASRQYVSPGIAYRENLLLFYVPDADAATLNLMAEQLLDGEPDVIVVFSTPLTQAILNLTQNMDDPPPVFFAAVYDPYESGLADAPCIKPDNVTGVMAVNPYEDIVPLLVKQDPDIQTVGVIFNSSFASGLQGANDIQRIAEGLGLTVEMASVTAIADMRLAAEGLVSKGVEAIIMPDDMVSQSGLQLVVNATLDDQIPVYYSSNDALRFGATVSAGFYEYYRQGEAVGVMLAAYLNGELDIAKTAITQVGSENSMVYGVNTAMAETQGIEISQEMMDDVGFIATEMSGTTDPTSTSERVTAEIMQVFAPFSLEERLEANAAFLASTVCTDEMIAEQQAQLDAMDG